MRLPLATLPLLLACGPSDPVPLAVAFDTERATVGRVTLPAGHTLDALEATVDGEPLDHVLVRGDRLIGLPQDTTLTLSGTATDDRDRPRELAPLTLTVPGTGLATLTVVQSAPDAAMATGLVFAAVLDDDRSGLAAYDGAGRLRWGWRASDNHVTAAPVFARNGLDVLAFTSHRDRDTDDAAIHRFPLDGSPGTTTTAVAGHHAFVEMPSGELAFLSRNFPEVDAPPEAAESTWTLLNDTIRLAPEGSTDGGTVVFDLLEAEPFTRSCAHVDTLHSRYGNAGIHDWSHANSLVYDEAADTWVYGIRLHDAILGIDPATGDVRWKAGGTSPDLVPDDPWSHSHFTEASNDRVLLFDNGTHKQPESSRVVELALDHDAGTATVVWSFEQPFGGFTAWLGDGRTLPNGHRLLAFTEVGRLLEVRPDGSIAWEAALPNPNVGRIRFALAFDALDPG